MSVSELLVEDIEDEDRATEPTVPEEVLSLARGPRVLGELGEPGDGPTLICVGSLHGNEPAGILALARFFERVDATKLELRGRMVGLAGNRRALAAGCRYLRDDLNRYWNKERLAHLRGASAPLEAEDQEIVELDRELERVLGESHGPVSFLDLHTTSGFGPAFANLDDTLDNREFALEFPVPLVVGIEEELAGTLASYLNDRGIVTLGFESGQHDEPQAVDRAEAAIWIALEASGLLARGSRPEPAAARQRLAHDRGGLPHVVEVLYRHAIAPGDHFEMMPGFRNFQTVHGGEILAHDEHGPVLAAFDGHVLMPLYQRQGDDGFFLVRPVLPLWLKLSEYARRLEVDRFLHLLPGVRKNPERTDSFIVDRRWARFFALEIFHLLGFRRQGELSRFVVMTRRSHDR